MGLQSWETAQVVQTVLTGVALFPAIALFVCILRKPGAKHDHTRRWVDYTKATLGLWSASTLLSLICWIMMIVVDARRQWGRPKEYDAISYISAISLLPFAASEITLFLALFYLAHALTQLRAGAEADDSAAYRAGRKATLGAAVLIGLLAVVSFCLRIAVEVLVEQRRESGSYGDWDDIYKISQASNYLQIANAGILAIVAIGITVYAVMAFNKSRGSPVHKAATLLLIAIFLYDVTRLWSVIWIILWFVSTYLLSPPYVGLVDVFLGVWPTAAVMALLYLLASKDSYSLSRIHYRVDDDEQVA